MACGRPAHRLAEVAGLRKMISPLLCAPLCEQPLVERRLDREFVDGLLDCRLRIRCLDLAKQRGRCPLEPIDGPTVLLTWGAGSGACFFGGRLIDRVAKGHARPIWRAVPFLGEVEADRTASTSPV
jgi:hypothetical protein